MVQVRFALFRNLIENPYLFLNHLRSSETLLKEERFALRDFGTLSIGALQCVFPKTQSIEVKVFPRVASLYIRESAKTPPLTGSIIHTFSSALKCHLPRRDFQQYRSIMPPCVKPKPTIIVLKVLTMLVAVSVVVALMVLVA